MANFDMVKWIVEEEELNTSKAGIVVAEQVMASLANTDELHNNQVLMKLMLTISSGNNVETMAAKAFIAYINFALKEFAQYQQICNTTKN
ncbi:hypothetical protein [Alishewanella sp. HL-SH06]|uniref:hypothetical protein n=1 Tax=Alishewanella sp. HL-SH06 TaxID=3461144 RepID=UPI0040427470